MRESDDDDQFWKRNRFRKRNKKVVIKHGFEGARELILAWHGLRVCASASLLGGQCHFSSPRVLHSLVLWTGMPRNLVVTLPPSMRKAPEQQPSPSGALGMKACQSERPSSHSERTRSDTPCCKQSARRTARDLCSCDSPRRYPPGTGGTTPRPGS